MLGFFKYLVELGPKTIKLQSWQNFVRKREDPTEEDQQLLDDKIKQCHKDKANKKRKAEEDINDRYAKIAKLDLPPLFTDNLIELLCRFNTKDLLTASRVNKQFYAVSRKLLYTREVTVTHKKFYNTTAKQLPFVMQLKKLKFEQRSIDTECHDDKYTQLLAQMTNLQSIHLPLPDEFIFPALNNLTQLMSMTIIFQKEPFNGVQSPISMLKFDAFKELKELSLAQVPKLLTTELLPLSQLTSLSLKMVKISSLRKFNILWFLGQTGGHQAFY